MCGILVYGIASLEQPEIADLEKSIRNRGPDHFGRVELNGIVFNSSVLSLRYPFTQQPIVEDSEILMFNGEIYSTSGNDSQWMWENRRTLRTNPPEGEYAFCWYDGDKIYFGRDSIGRRSLVYRHTTDGTVISSVPSSNSTGWIECDAGIVYVCDSISAEPKPLLNFKKTAKLTRVAEQTGEEIKASSQLIELLKKSVGDRMVLPHSSQPRQISVLFSGGLDCTVLAKLIDLILPRDYIIELVNVAFENKRTGQLPSQAPDRILAQRVFKEEFGSSTRVRLSLQDISYDQAMDQIDRVRTLMYPSDTVMDVSIALAFYFAAARSSSRVLISGLGADEIFGGYARHARSSDLATELEIDFNRLGSRNLGRDDRVQADNGKETRYPYLDSRVLNFAFDLPLNYKKDKSVLREAAKILELKSVTLEKKRAIQFGARSAKMDPGSGRVKGQDRID